MSHHQEQSGEGLLIFAVGVLAAGVAWGATVLDHVPWLLPWAVIAIIGGLLAALVASAHGHLSRRGRRLPTPAQPPPRPRSPPPPQTQPLPAPSRRKPPRSPARHALAGGTAVWHRAARPLALAKDHPWLVAALGRAAGAAEDRRRPRRRPLAPRHHHLTISPGRGGQPAHRRTLRSPPATRSDRFRGVALRSAVRRRRGRTPSGSRFGTKPPRTRGRPSARRSERRCKTI